MFNQGLIQSRSRASLHGSVRSQIQRAVISSALLAALTGCDLNNPPQPQGGGYTAPKPDEPGTPKPEAKSVLGRAKQSAERIIEEDIAEYNRKLEEAADGKFE